jgi:hypothetical protein
MQEAKVALLLLLGTLCLLQSQQVIFRHGYALDNNLFNLVLLLIFDKKLLTERHRTTGTFLVIVEQNRQSFLS